MSALKKVMSRKCWIYERREDCDKFRFKGERLACGGEDMDMPWECADRITLNDRIKLKGP